MQTEDKHGDSHIQVAVATTAGFFPETGFDNTAVHQPVSVILKQAAQALRLTDTSTWAVTVDKRAINPDLSYVENGLTGEATLDWGPREGGGGCA